MTMKLLTFLFRRKFRHLGISPMAPITEADIDWASAQIRR